MPAPANEFAFDLEVVRQAADRWNGRQEKRDHKQETIAEKQFDAVESKERLAKRANRLLDQVREQMESAPGTVPPALGEMAARGPVAPADVNNLFIERVIGDTRDFLSIEFLERALHTNRCVGRISTKLSGGRRGFGTGFLVTPRLLLTNQHVLRDAEDAAASSVEFDYQLDYSGQPLAVERFALEPETFFVNDKELDFALVAVAEASARGCPLSGFGYTPLIAAEGKITLGEPINIIQHPRGEMKQIVIRENKLLDMLELFLHYEADTEPGSSGSPVFNDQWEMVGLHHSGVPKTDAAGNLLDIHGKIWSDGDDPALLAWVGNEGVRVSRLVAFIATAKASGTRLDLRDELIALSKNGSRPVAPKPREEQTMKNSIGDASASHRVDVSANGHAAAAPQSVTLTIPLNITVTLGQPLGAPPPPARDEPSEMFAEIQIDPDYDSRPGYDPNFLGFEVPLPKLSNAVRAQAFKLDGLAAPGAYELKYYHYSVLFNKKRRLAFVAAVNLDASPRFKHKRDGKDKWFMDPRVGVESQAGEDLYAGNPLDRGHLVRRDDAAWGGTKKEAQLANDDTFHFTNCSPQHEIYNQSGLASSQGVLLWGNLENHIARQAKENNKKLCIFNGPIFRSNDRKHAGVQIPKEFFKVVTFEHDDGEPRSLAFILSQASLIKDLPAEEFEVGPYRPFQVTISELESRTKLKFGPLRQYDPLESGEQERFFESDLDAVAIESLEDVIVGVRSPRRRLAPR